MDQALQNSPGPRPRRPSDWNRAPSSRRNRCSDRIRGRVQDEDPGVMDAAISSAGRGRLPRSRRWRRASLHPVRVRAARTPCPRLPSSDRRARSEPARRLPRSAEPPARPVRASALGLEARLDRARLSTGRPIVGEDLTPEQAEVSQGEAALFSLGTRLATPPAWASSHGHANCMVTGTTVRPTASAAAPRNRLVMGSS